MLKYRQFSVQSELDISYVKCTGFTGNLSLTLSIHVREQLFFSGPSQQSESVRIQTRSDFYFYFIFR